MRRGRAGLPTGLFPVPERPKPTYPEHEWLVAAAQASVRADNGFVDPVKLRNVQSLPRTHDWRISVLGHDGERTLVEMHMLLLAHEQDLDPPLPQWVVDARAEARRREAERDAKLKELNDMFQARWDEVSQGCLVEVSVWRNGRARAHYGYAHHLGHVVPKVDAVSGRCRRHLAGRALCETEQRAQPLDLSGGEGGPATCVSCLDYTPKIRPASTPA